MFNFWDIPAALFGIAIVLPFFGGFVWVILQFYRIVYWALMNFTMREPNWNSPNQEVDNDPELKAKNEEKNRWLNLFLILMAFALMLKR